MNERLNEDESKSEGVALVGVDRRHNEMLSVLTRIADGQDRLAAGQERLCDLIDEFLEGDEEDEDKAPQAPRRPR